MRGITVDPNKLRAYLKRLVALRVVMIGERAYRIEGRAQISEVMQQALIKYGMRHLSFGERTLRRMLKGEKVDINSIKTCCHALTILLREVIVPEHILPGPSPVPLALHLLQLHTDMVGKRRNLDSIPDLFSPFLVSSPVIKYGLFGRGEKTIQRVYSGSNECYEFMTWLAESYLPIEEPAIKYIGPDGDRVPLIFTGMLQSNRKSAKARRVTGHMLYEFREGKVVSLEENFIFE